MSNTKKNDDLIKNLESDIIYAAVVILISGVCGKAIADSLTESIAGAITVAFVTVIISFILSIIIPYLLKMIFVDELNDVLSTPVDFVVCAGIMMGLAIICKDMIGPNYLIEGISAVVGLSIKYFDIINLVKDYLGKRNGD